MHKLPSIADPVGATTGPAYLATLGGPGPWSGVGVVHGIREMSFAVGVLADRVATARFGFGGGAGLVAALSGRLMLPLPATVSPLKGPTCFGCAFMNSAWLPSVGIAGLEGACMARQYESIVFR